MLDSVEVQDTADELTKQVVVGADYAVYQNYGTRYLPPLPFWEPGIEDAEVTFAADVAEIGDELTGSIG